MDDTAHQGIASWFHTFVRGYERENALHPMLQLKLDHSLRVATECRSIAGELGWPTPSVRMAETVGLLHDIGRFPQFDRFQTFNDAISADHGEMAHQVLMDTPVLRACTETSAGIIRASVRYHNRRRIPDSTPADGLPFLRLIRDADKLDILHIVNETILKKDYHRYPEILLNIDLNGPPTPDLVREIRDTRGGSYKNVKSLADTALMRLSWIYDLNYGPTFRRIQERGLLEGIDSLLPPDPDIRAISAGVRRHIEQHLANSSSYS